MNALARKIRRQIQHDGPISFARFMELALYEPGLGYYERPGRIGSAGDFFTSVSTGPLFGQLLAFQFAEWLDSQCPEGKFQVVEAGAHDGSLAADILDWLSRHRPDLLPRLEYCIVESSKARVAWQEKTLRSWKSNLRWVPDISDFGQRQIDGIVFSNEFLDALPVHRLAWDSKESRWREWRVTVADGNASVTTHLGMVGSARRGGHPRKKHLQTARRAVPARRHRPFTADDAFAWHLDMAATDLNGCLPPVPPDLAAVLPNGFITEVSPVAVDWWRSAGRALRRGKLLTIDYGFSAGIGLRPDSPNGTLRAFVRHNASVDLLAQPGEQDLTAHVNFSALEEAGRSAGLGPGILVGQSKFLTQILAKIHASPQAFAPWDRKTARQFQTLSHPEHLGRPFQVFIQY